jgi:hypothetical protein
MKAMSRVSRIPYHQNVYDLLQNQIESGACPKAARMFAEHEVKHGPLPMSVTEWYCVPDIAPFAPRWEPRPGYRYWGYNNYHTSSILDVLDRHAQRRADAAWPYVAFMAGRHEGQWWWYLIKLDGSEDPPVYEQCGKSNPRDWNCVGTFSDFVQLTHTKIKPISRPWGLSMKYPNGLWLRTSDEPFHPPVIDFLIEQFGDPEITARVGNVSTYTFHPTSGTIRVTADEPMLVGGLSAWWVHADTSYRLREFARLLFPWGALRDTLRADTDPAREVLNRVRCV